MVICIYFNDKVTSICGPLSSLAALFNAWTCCISKSQYNLNSDFLYFNESGLPSPENTHI